MHKGSRKKSSCLSGRATKRGGGQNGGATKEKRTVFNVRKKFLWTLSRGPGGSKGISGRATKKRNFYGFPNVYTLENKKEYI